MVSNRGKGLIAQIEEKLGLPPLSQVAEGLQKFPDMPRLRLIKSILETCERLSRTSLELEKVVALADTPTEKLEKLEKVLEKLEKVLKRIEGIMNKAPEELLSFLTSLREE